MTNAGSTGARTRARELLVQALYQKPLAGHSSAELLGNFICKRPTSVSTRSFSTGRYRKSVIHRMNWN